MDGVSVSSNQKNDAGRGSSPSASKTRQAQKSLGLLFAGWLIGMIMWLLIGATQAPGEPPNLPVLTLVDTARSNVCYVGNPNFNLQGLSCLHTPTVGTLEK